MDLTYLRLLIDERIPAGGTEADTSFTDAELVAIASNCNDDINLTASEVWRIKAGMVKTRIASYSLGEESVTYAGLQELYDHAVLMSAEYKKKGSPTAVFSQTPPDVLHEDDE